MSGEIEDIEWEFLTSSAAFWAGFGTGVFDEDAAHGFSRGVKEVGLVRPFGFVISDEAGVGFVYESGGLESMIGAFEAHAMSGEFSQLFVNQRQQFSGGLPVALTHLVK